MKILVACEFSGRVRDAFIAKGHDAYSCDFRPTESPGPHYEGDVLDILGDRWDMLIAFPDCTYLTSSGLHWNKRRPERAELTEKALRFVDKLLKADIKKKVLENPVGCISTRIRKPSQIIQPWQFGEDASKKTCFWLEGLPELKHTKIFPPKGYNLVKSWSYIAYRTCIVIGGYMFGTNISPPPKPVWSNQTPSGQNKLGPSPDRAKIRSLTYPGIADAMAEQWG